MVYKKKIQDAITDTMDVTDENKKVPEAPKKVKIKVLNFKTEREPGTEVTLYGIKFTIQKNGDLIGETLPAIAKAGVDAGLYKKA